MTDSPRAGRPRVPASYGISPDVPDTTKRPWTNVTSALASARNYWVSTTRADGRPHAMPVWGVLLDDAVMFSTGRRSVKGRNLARTPDAIVHLESGDEVVILEGRVEEARDPELLQRFADAYEKKYAFRPDPTSPGGVTYLLRPRVALVWSEKDFPESATRWEFVAGP
jgi:PPOX class probable F420-dependent enzyme